MNKAEKSHASKVAELGCVVCFRLYGPHDPGHVELHHVRRGTGMAQRSSHFDVIPLCIEHHRGNTGIHGLGTKGFTKHYGFTEADLLDAVRGRLA
jgi:hypothetical protein